jgi:riboflavin kinase/FMN adenylyltransferase
MQILRHIDDESLQSQRSVVTLGNFDGVHVGHRALVGGAVADARQLGILSVVLTFEPHPLKILAPDRAPRMLLTHKDKMQLLQSLGIDIVVIQTFDLAFAKIEAADFVRWVLAGRLKAKKIWVGRDLRFGQGRRGNVDDLKRWGNDLDFQVSLVDPVLVNGARVSSSRIRQLVSEGQVDKVKPMLGRHHFVSGRVVNGHRRGREIGFPTANIATRTEVLPADGIYATLFHLGEEELPSVSSVGLNPTFGEGPRTVESYIMNFNREIYGEAVRLSFVQRIRDERKFASAIDLTAQIREDVTNARKILESVELAHQ